MGGYLEAGLEEKEEEKRWNSHEDPAHGIGYLPLPRGDHDGISHGGQLCGQAVSRFPGGELANPHPVVACLRGFENGYVDIAHFPAQGLGQFQCIALIRKRPYLNGEAPTGTHVLTFNAKGPSLQDHYPHPGRSLFNHVDAPGGGIG